MLKIDKGKTVNNIKSIKEADGDVTLINNQTRNFLGKFYFHGIETKEIKQFIKNVEKLVRTSDSYKKYIGYLGTQGLTHDVTMKNITQDKATLEFHHYPFTLYDIVEIIVNYHMKKNDRFTSLSIAEEVIECHFENLIGVARLSKTNHQLTHSGCLFIPLASVFGNVNKFVEKYYDGLFTDQIETYNTLVKLDTEYTASRA